MTWVEPAVAETFRAEWGRLLSLLVVRTRRFDLAEDALSEAFARASDRWTETGVPDNPAAWLYTTASRIVAGQLRSEAIHGRKAHLLAVGTEWHQPLSDDELGSLGDERVALVLLCCHPAVNAHARSALALRLVIGTSTDEIARLFLVSRATMAARITRAKKKIVGAGIPLSSPVDEELRSRLDDVCRTIYLAFTAGYAPGSGADLSRADLAGDAVELAAVLHRLVPEAKQVQALYGLLLLQHGRRDARAHDGELVPLAEQDRLRWRRDELDRGAALVAELGGGSGFAEELRLQGLIASQHAHATRAADTDWSAIASLYAHLESLTGSAIVRLNRAVAAAEAEGPSAGLALLDGLGDTLSGNHRFHAVHADLARRAGDLGAARASYLIALDLCTNDVERAFLTHRLHSLH